MSEENMKRQNFKAKQRNRTKMPWLFKREEKKTADPLYVQKTKRRNSRRLSKWAGKVEESEMAVNNCSGMETLGTNPHGAPRKNKGRRKLRDIISGF